MYLIYPLLSFSQEPQDEETDATPPESEKSVMIEEKPITTTSPEIKLETSHDTLEPYDPNVPVGKMALFFAKK